MNWFKPYKFLILGFLVFWMAYIFGPYNHTIYNYEGLIYVFIIFFLFIASSYMADVIGRRGEDLQYTAIISPLAELYLIVVMLVGVVAFLIFMYEVVNLPIVGGYKFASDDYRDILSIHRTTINKIAEIVMLIGTTAYLIVSRIKELNYNLTRGLSIIALFLPAVSILAVGGRSRVVTSIGLFGIIFLMTKTQKDSNYKIKKEKVSYIKFIICAFLIGILFYFTFSLFSTRGMYTAPEQYLIYKGDITIKPIYQDIYVLTQGKINPLYKASLYYTHSIPVFTQAFEALKSANCHYGAFLFFLEGYILRLVGIPFPDYLAIARESPVPGLYSSFITGYIQDWGMLGTLFAVILTGIIFGRLSHNAYKKKASYYLLPVILFMCWVSPIYYFWHMGWESVLLFFPIVYFPCRMLGLGRRCTKDKTIAQMGASINHEQSD